MPGPCSWSSENGSPGDVDTAAGSLTSFPLGGRVSVGSPGGGAGLARGLRSAVQLAGLQRPFYCTWVLPPSARVKGMCVRLALTLGLRTHVCVYQVNTSYTLNIYHYLGQLLLNRVKERETGCTPASFSCSACSGNTPPTDPAEPSDTPHCPPHPQTCERPLASPCQPTRCPRPPSLPPEAPDSVRKRQAMSAVSCRRREQGTRSMCTTAGRAVCYTARRREWASAQRQALSPHPSGFASRTLYESVTAHAEPRIRTRSVQWERAHLPVLQQQQHSNKEREAGEKNLITWFV